MPAPVCPVCSTAARLRPIQNSLYTSPFIGRPHCFVQRVSQPRHGFEEYGGICLVGILVDEVADRRHGVVLQLMQVPQPPFTIGCDVRFRQFQERSPQQCEGDRIRRVSFRFARCSHSSLLSFITVYAVYAGIRFAHGANPLPGSGSTQRYYAHVNFCERCLSKRSECIQGFEDSSYSLVQFDASSGSMEEVDVPQYDKRYGR